MVRTTKPSEIRIEGDRAYITLSRGREGIIDAADVDLVRRHRWYALSTPTGHLYVCRSRSNKVLLLHRFLTDAPPDKYVDHINGDGLDNRRGNLRLCTNSQNQANSRGNRQNTSGIKGVSKAKGGFQAHITFNNEKITLGTFKTLEEAAAARKGAARIAWGDYARD